MVEFNVSPSVLARVEVLLYGLPRPPPQVEVGGCLEYLLRQAPDIPRLEEIAVFALAHNLRAAEAVYCDWHAPGRHRLLEGRREPLPHRGQNEDVAKPVEPCCVPYLSEEADVCDPQVVGEPLKVGAVWPIAADIVETEYKLAGKEDEFNSEDIRYLSPQQFGYSSNYMGIMMRERPAANIMIGAYWAESLQLGETGNRAGAFQISGTANTHQIPFFLVTTDYCLIGEEIFSAGAYLTQDAPLIASLAGQDAGRIIAVILSVLGVLLATVGSDLLLDLLGM